eukprot:3453100-Prymnesium_polylepis.1
MPPACLGAGASGRRRLLVRLVGARRPHLRDAARRGERTLLRSLPLPLILTISRETISRDAACP